MYVKSMASVHSESESRLSRVRIEWQVAKISDSNRIAVESQRLDFSQQVWCLKTGSLAVSCAGGSPVVAGVVAACVVIMLNCVKNRLA